ncbi:MAG: CbiQ family ECF transporter T component, partial [Mycobacterium sp.]
MRNVARASRRTVELHLLRYVPGDSPVHRLWAGTKLIAVAGFSLVLTFKASWSAEAVLAGVLLAVLLLARIPIGAAPRLPAWILVLGLGLGFVVAVLAGGRPELHLLGQSIGLGSLGTWARFVVLTFLLLLAAYLVGWTTPLAELAPA